MTQSIPISAYEELIAEKQKLEILFEAQKALVKYEFEELRDEITPALNVIDFLKKLSFRNKDNPLIQSGINILIDMIAEKINSNNTDIIKTKIVPYILKNYTSHLLAGATVEFVQQVTSLFNQEEENNNGSL
ncbi:MAG TPA: hypothetical protein PKC72_11460 [Chitinophagaceae bacterium]|nr:hypothetical protein [Chitinophagaceae bacterium]